MNNTYKEIELCTVKLHVSKYINDTDIDKIDPANTEKTFLAVSNVVCLTNESQEWLTNKTPQKLTTSWFILSHGAISFS